MSMYLKQWLQLGMEEHQNQVEVEGTVTEVKEEETTAELEVTDVETEGGGTEAPVSDEEVKAESKPEGTDDAAGEVVSSEELSEVKEEETSAELEDVESEGDGTAAPESDCLITVDDDDTLKEACEAYTGVIDDLDQMDKIHTTLEKYNEVLTLVTDAKRGLDPVAAEILRIGTEALDDSFIGEVVTGLEAFGAKDGRHDATVLSMEALGENMRKVGRAIAAAVRKLMDILADIWDDLFNRYGRMKGEADKVLKQLKDLAGKEPETDQMGLTGMDPGLMHNFKYNITSDLKELNKVAAMLAGDRHAKLLEKTNQLVTAGIKASDLDLAKEEAEEVLKKVHEEIKSLYDTSRTFPGGRRFEVRKAGGMFGQEEVIEFVETKETGSTKSEVIIKTPTPKEMENVVYLIKGITEVYTSNRKLIDTYRKERKHLDAQLKLIDEDSATGRIATLRLRATKAALETIARPSRDFNRYVYRLLKTYLAVTHRAISLYK